HHRHHERPRLGSRPVDARGRRDGEVGRGRDRQALARGLHAPPSRAARRLAADQPQRLPRLASGGRELRPPSRGRRRARRRQGRAPLGALTHADLQRRARVFAERLAERGVRAGDTIAVAIPNRWTFAVALLGGWQLGATVAPLDPLLKSDERAAILADLAPTLLVESSAVPADEHGTSAGAEA